MSTCASLVVSFMVLAAPAQPPERAFPGAEWPVRDAAEAGVDAGALDMLAEQLGGRGCVVKDGYIVKSWGDLAQRGDWFSAAKPVLSTMLFFAIEEGRVRDVDQPIAEFGWEFKQKDRGITFRHLGSMSSGYARPEGPGQAWAYNDYAIQLYQITLFDRVFKGDAKAVAETPNRLGALGLQDGLEFNQKRRLFASTRDFARIAWLWLNKGRWGDRQVLPERYFDELMRPQAPKDLPQTVQADTDDYLGIGSYGGESDHFSKAGPGIYGFNWWFNDTGRLHPHSLTWPDAPRDTVMAIGARGNCAAIMPSLGLAVVCAEGDWGDPQGGDRDSRMNRALGLAAQACGFEKEPVLVTGDLRKWAPVTLSFEGPSAEETRGRNPFTDYRLTVAFTHDGRTIDVPGYYAADGNAAESGGEAGNVWRVHFAPDAEGVWEWQAAFYSGPGVATGDGADPAGFDGLKGSLDVKPFDASAPGFLAKGTLRYTGKRYLRFAETGEYFLKGGADSPENFLAYADFDGTTPTHRYEPHAGDWHAGDPTWQGGKGKNILGALNYLASEGMNSVYFLTMNVEGDGKDVWPWTRDSERFRFDCSKLDQWEVVFSHMDRQGIMLHVLTQETENDQLLDGGELGSERKLYYRELIARFAHHPAVVWNLGEENTNTDAQRKAFADYIRELDPYDHPIVVHTFPGDYDKVYTPLLGHKTFDGPSLQMGEMRETYAETLKWVRRSAEAGRPWCVWLDEIGPANIGVKPDAVDPDHDDVRRYALWGNLMAGGAGCEWYLGYDYPDNDVACENWRSRDRMWDQTRYALEFFRRYLPFHDMEPVEGIVSDQEAWCLAKPGEVYAIYVSRTEGLAVDLPEGRYTVDWYNPRGGTLEGGAFGPGLELRGGGRRYIGSPLHEPNREWVALIRKAEF